MASRKPLVIVDGVIQQLQSGDTLDATANEVDFVTATNSNAAAIVICSPVYVDGAGTVDLAQADAAATVEVLGLVATPTEIAIAGEGSIQTDGVLTATTDEWDAVTGDTGGLTAGSVYYLDPDTAGMLTTTGPTTVADLVARVGVALSTVALEISKTQPILL